MEVLKCEKLAVGAVSKRKGNKDNFEVIAPEPEFDLLEDTDTEKYEESEVIKVAETSPKDQNKKKDLISGCRDYCNFAETRALDLLAHFNHPVLPWMRDLNKTHIDHFINNPTKTEDPVERSVGLILMIDYISAAIENPLYSDSISLHFDNLHEDLLKKLLFELRRIALKWAYENNKEAKLRCEKITSYLVHLLPIYQYQSTRIQPIITSILDILKKKTITPQIKPSKRLPILFDDDEEEEEVKGVSIPAIISDNTKIKSKVDTDKASSSNSKRPTLQSGNSEPSTSKVHGIKAPSPKVARIIENGRAKSRIPHNPKVDPHAFMMYKRQFEDDEEVVNSRGRRLPPASSSGGGFGNGWNGVISKRSKNKTTNFCRGWIERAFYLNSKSASENELKLVIESLKTDLESFRDMYKMISPHSTSLGLVDPFLKDTMLNVLVRIAWNLQIQIPQSEYNIEGIDALLIKNGYDVRKVPPEEVKGGRNGSRTGFAQGSTKIKPPTKSYKKMQFLQLISDSESDNGE